MGFTLIELTVTLAIVALLASFAAPSLRGFFVRNAFSTLGNEFSGSVLRARNEAISKNSCVTMCMSDTAASTTPFCKPKGKDWQVGWIVFQNPRCDADYGKDAAANAIAPEDMILARNAGNTSYTLDATSKTPVRKLQFGPGGNSGMGGLERFKLGYPADAVLAGQYAFNICLSMTGRTRFIAGAAEHCV